jgi:hypothetical protein
MDGGERALRDKEVVMHRTTLITLGVLVGLSTSAYSDAPTVDRDALRTELAAQRTLNLKRFAEYRRAQVYPHNSYENGKLNVWRDADGHLCAVANLMAKQGLDKLVDSTATEQNFVRIADVTSGPLIDWVLTSGLTQEEIVMIQWPTMVEDLARERREGRIAARARKREDKRLEAGYLATERALKQSVVRDAGLDLAVARLEKRADLVAALHAQSKQIATK